MVKDHSDSEMRKPAPTTYRIAHTTASVTPVVDAKKHS